MQDLTCNKFIIAVYCSVGMLCENPNSFRTGYIVTIVSSVVGNLFAVNRQVTVDKVFYRARESAASQTWQTALQLSYGPVSYTVLDVSKFQEDQ